MSNPIKAHRWPTLFAFVAAFTLGTLSPDAGAATPYFSAPIDFDLEAAETDPHGNAAVPTSTLSLSEEEIARVRAAEGLGTGS